MLTADLHWNNTLPTSMESETPTATNQQSKIH